MDSPAIWAGIFLAVAAAFGIGEIAMPGSFFLLPFAAGGIVAATVSLLGAPLLISFPVFIAVSFVVFLGLRPLARKMEADTPDVAGIGSNRLVGVTGVVTTPIAALAGEAGMVKIEGEEWRADASGDFAIPDGSKIRVVAVRGTRLVVEPVGVVDFPELG